MQRLTSLHNVNKSPVESRRGTMIVIMLFLLMVTLTMVVFTVDTAYMQLVRTELRAATDAAAKAGAASLNETGGDVTAAKNAAIAMAARNTVAGRPLTLSLGDIQVGNSTKQSDGFWKFNDGASPATAVRVNATMSSATSAGPVNLFFGKMIGVGTFTPQETATASQMQQDIVLAVDRSHSMCFDESGVDWQYPTGIPNLPLSLKQPPHPTKSRWAALMRGIDEFNEILSQNGHPPQIALVTWGSKITSANYEGWYTGESFDAVNIDKSLTTDFPKIKQLIHGRGAKIMLGGTNMSAGLDEALNQINGSGCRPLAKKFIILMTDGQWNQGRDPILCAQEAQAAGVVIHTITFLDGVDQTKMDEVAELTGGMHYHASNGDELVAIFEYLALSLPIAITD